MPLSHRLADSPVADWGISGAQCGGNRRQSGAVQLLPQLLGMALQGQQGHYDSGAGLARWREGQGEKPRGGKRLPMRADIAPI